MGALELLLDVESLHQFGCGAGAKIHHAPSSSKNLSLPENIARIANAVQVTI